MYDNLTILLTIGFLLVSLLIGFFASRKEDSEGYLIANRKMNTFQSIMTLCGTFVGAMTLIVYTAFVFTYGISAIWVYIGYVLGFYLFSRFAVHLKTLSKEKKFYTITDYFQYRFGRLTALLVITVIFVWYFGTLSAQFIGGGKILADITGINFEISAIIMALVIIAYLLMGGFQSVVRTDVFQFLVLGLILITIGITLTSGVSVPIEYFNPFNAGALNIIAFLLLGILSPFATQDFWQRVYAMKDVKTVKRSFMISSILVLLISVFLTYLGLVARSYFSDIDPDLAVLRSFTELVPEFMVGFVAVAFFSAILSTADTFLFVLSVNFINDILGVGKDGSEKMRRYTRIAIVSIGLGSLVLALIFQNIVDITLIFKAIGLVISPIVIIVWLSKGNPKAINTAIIGTIIIIGTIAALGYVRPELSFISTFGGTLIYFAYNLLRMKE